MKPLDLDVSGPDAAFIAHARTDIPALLARVRELEASERRLIEAAQADERAHRERAAVVAWLRAEAYLTLYESTPQDVADCIERGDHRTEVTNGSA